MASRRADALCTLDDDDEKENDGNDDTMMAVSEEIRIDIQ